MDSGIGMTLQELLDCFGTIEQSGVVRFLKEWEDINDSRMVHNLIAQYSIRFLSAFLLSDKVSVATRCPESDNLYVWEGDFKAHTYTIREESAPQNIYPRGTCVTLYMKHDDKGFADPEWIRKLVQNYSQISSYPIYTWQEKGYTKQVEVGEDSAQTKKEVEDVEFVKNNTVVENYWDWELVTQPLWEPIWLYKKIFIEHLDPLASSQFTIEGEVEARCILYVSSIFSEKRFGVMNIEFDGEQVLIFDGKLLPSYLSFIRGVAVLTDPPLNVSRETLQETVKIMRERLIREALIMILGISMSDDKDIRRRFWDDFGMHIKLRCLEDFENHKHIVPLLLFFSSQSECYYINLDEYVANMPPDQKDIYYIASNSKHSAWESPFLEKVLEKDLEVLYLVDPIDEVVLRSLKSFEGMNFVDLSSEEDLDLGDKKEKEIKQQEFSKTCDWIKKRLRDKVASVRISNRLTSSASIVVSDKCDWSAERKRLMKEYAERQSASTFDFVIQNQEGNRRVFEINPDHPYIKKLQVASFV